MRVGQCYCSLECPPWFMLRRSLGHGGQGSGLHGIAVAMTTTVNPSIIGGRQEPLPGVGDRRQNPKSSEDKASGSRLCASLCPSLATHRGTIDPRRKVFLSLFLPGTLCCRWPSHNTAMKSLWRTAWALERRSPALLPVLSAVPLPATRRCRVAPAGNGGGRGNNVS